MPIPSSTNAIADAKNTAQFVSFEIGDQQYAFGIEQIQEIVILKQVTQTPKVADFVEGVSNLRGAIIPIINLRQLLGLPSRPIDDESRTIVVNVGEKVIGCRVDSVSQVIRIPEDSIQPAPDTLTSNGNQDIAGFAKMDDRLVIVLDVNELLSPDRFQRHHETTPEPS